MTVVRLSSGRLILFSTLNYSDELARDLSHLGEVAYILGPSSYHTDHLGELLSHYPGATVHAVPAVKSKLQRPNVEVLENGRSAPWSDELDHVVYLGSKKFQEAVFCHRESKTLLITDLAFALRRPVGLKERILWRVFGFPEHLGPTRLCRHLSKDLDGLRKTIETLLRWDFDKAVVGHGMVPVESAKSKIESGFEFVLRNR